MDIGSFQAEEFGELQRLVDGLYAGRQTVDRLDMVVQGEILDLSPDLMEIINLLPPRGIRAPAPVRPAQFGACGPRLGRYVRNGRVGECHEDTSTATRRGRRRRGRSAEPS